MIRAMTKTKVTLAFCWAIGLFAALVIADSVYLGRQGEISRSEQIVLSGPFKGAATEIKWALSRVPLKQ